MTMLSIVLGAVLAVAVFYWFISTLIDVAAACIRVSGYSSTSAVPGVATIMGLVAVAIAREHFGWIESPILYLIAILPDVILQIGELVLVLRIKIFHLPDKAAQAGEKSDST